MRVGSWRDELSRFGLVAVGGVSILVFAFHQRLFLDRFGRPGGLFEAELEATIAGTYAAPFQYRMLAPLTVDALRDLGLDVHQSTTVVVATSLVAAGVLGVVLFSRAERTWALAAAAAWLAVIGVGAAFWPKPETYPAMAVLTAAAILLVDDRLPRWLLVPLALALAGLRTDLVWVLGVAFGARWLLDRRKADLLTAAGLVAGGGAATLALMAIYPDAEYPERFPLFQLWYNLRGESVVVLAVLLVLPLYPLMAFGLRRLLAGRDGRLGLVLVAPHVAEVVLTAVVGRVMEVRIFLPLVWPTALGVVLLWQQGLRHLASERVDDVPMTVSGATSESD